MKHPNHKALMNLHIVAGSVWRCIEIRRRVAVIGSTWTVISLNAVPDNQHVVLVDLDLHCIESVLMLRQNEHAIRSAAHRIFVTDVRDRHSIAQAFALGATTVRPNLESLGDLSVFQSMQLIERDAEINGAVQYAEDAFLAVFDSFRRNVPLDYSRVLAASEVLSTSVRRFGLTRWLTIIRSHHKDTFEHGLVVMGLAIEFADYLRFPVGDIKTLCTCALLQDIGMATLPNRLLDKAKHLSGDERALLETHAISGHAFLRKIPGVSPKVVEVVRHHHEYLDGSGYPDQLAGEELSDAVRILAIAGSFADLIRSSGAPAPMSRGDAYQPLCGMAGKLEMALVLEFRDVALYR